MKTQHTPGPWIVEITGKEAFVTAEHGGLCAAISVGKANGQDKANAHLIAAAPDLLAALIRCLPEISVCCIPEMLAQARAAIAKAEQGE